MMIIWYSLQFLRVPFAREAVLGIGIDVEVIKVANGKPVHAVGVRDSVG